MQPTDNPWKFVEDRRKPVYATLAAELDALRRGKKAISFFATDRTGLDEDLEEIQGPALARGLCVTVAPRGDVIDLFVHRADNAKRIAPLQKLLSQSPWSFKYEAELGTHLGYTTEQRRAWIAAERHARPAFGVVTMYGTALHHPRFALIPTLWWTAPGRVPAPYAKHPPGLRLFRVGVKPWFAAKLGARGQCPRSTSKECVAFASGERTPLERYTPTGWHRK